jgi:hypothetical protein
MNRRLNMKVYKLTRKEPEGHKAEWRTSTVKGEDILLIEESEEYARELAYWIDHKAGVVARSTDSPWTNPYLSNCVVVQRSELDVREEGILEPNKLKNIYLERKDEWKKWKEDRKNK